MCTFRVNNALTDEFQSAYFIVQYNAELEMRFNASYSSSPTSYFNIIPWYMGQRGVLEPLGGYLYVIAANTGTETQKFKLLYSNAVVALTMVVVLIAGI